MRRMDQLLARTRKIGSILFLQFFSFTIFSPLLLRSTRPVSPEHLHLYLHIELPIHYLLRTATGGGGVMGTLGIWGEN